MTLKGKELDLAQRRAKDAGRPWKEPEGRLRHARVPTRPEDHVWDLAGTKADHDAPTTYFLWGCKKCGARLVTETATKDGECMADQCPPDERTLRQHEVDENCLQTAVNAVHQL